jgi:catechol 2,3-dioxygenase-like lactoylglutathione lyase family enzyme
MPVNICKDSIDLGIVTKNSAALIKFYRDTLGLEQTGEQDMPGGGHMTRLMAGTTTVKIVVNGKDPKGEAAPG